MMDEPFNGMDPEGIVWMRGFLRSLAAQGRAVLVSSHLMSELQDTADHLVVIGRGRVIADTSVAALIEAASGDRVSVRTAARTEAMTVLAHAGATVAAERRRTCSPSPASPAERDRGRPDGSHIPFGEVSAHRASLEEAYMELTRDAVEFHAGGDAHDCDHPLPAPDRRHGGDGFAQLLHAEWTKFRTVRGWVIALIVAVLVMAGIRAALRRGNSTSSCQQVEQQRPGPRAGRPACPPPSRWGRAASR